MTLFFKFVESHKASIARLFYFHKRYRTSVSNDARYLLFLSVYAFSVIVILNYTIFSRLWQQQNEFGFSKNHPATADRMKMWRLRRSYKPSPARFFHSSLRPAGWRLPLYRPNGSTGSYHRYSRLFLYNGSLHPCGPKTAMEKPRRARFITAPEAPHFHSDGCIMMIFRKNYFVLLLS